MTKLLKVVDGFFIAHPPMHFRSGGTQQFHQRSSPTATPQYAYFYLITHFLKFKKRR
jgi:hypothetical protein